MARPRLVGLNHIALEVGDVEEALDFYGRVFDFELRGRSRRMAFVDMGDQFIALAAGRTQPPDAHRHIGLVVDDRDAAIAAARAAGAEIVDDHDLLDPWVEWYAIGGDESAVSDLADVFAVLEERFGEGYRVELARCIGLDDQVVVNFRFAREQRDPTDERPLQSRRYY